MPHKHTRRRDDDEVNFDLAPDKFARPLPAFQNHVKTARKGKKPPPPPTQQSRSKSKNNITPGYGADDTPRAFARMMNLQSGKTQRSGLDDGDGRKNKKRKTDNGQTNPPHEKKIEQVEVPRIQPGERMGDFAARVDRALPVGGLARKGKFQIEGMKERQTKTEKRLHKMYAEWREEDARRKEQLEELQEQAEEERDEKEAELGGQSIAFPTGRKAKRQRLVGETQDDDEDPWAILKTRRERPKGLHDVVQAPPTMKVVPKEKFKVKDGAKVDVANIPASAGSLKRREELSDARREVIERYRQMMKGGK